MQQHLSHSSGLNGSRLVYGLLGALGVSVALIVSAWRDTSVLGAPSVWPWLLTGLQVLSLWSAGRGNWWGWLLGGSVQLPWVAYAVMTNQIGFIPGCAISAFVQAYSFLHNPTRMTSTEVPV